MSDHCGRVVGHLLEHGEDLVLLGVRVRLHDLGKAVLQHVVGEGPQLPELLVSGEDLEGAEAEPTGRESEDDGGLLVLQSAVVEAVPWDRVIRDLAGVFRFRLGIQTSETCVCPSCNTIRNARFKNLFPLIFSISNFVNLEILATNNNS